MDTKSQIIKKLEGNKKYWFCPKCKCYPNVIKEIYSQVTETRKWDNNDCYELEDSDLDRNLISTRCGNCGEVLEER